MADGYNYNAIAEHPIIPEFDETLKWKWNGALLDLSELPFDEYTKTIFQTSGGGGGSTGSTPTIVTNAVTLSYDNSGANYEIVATMEYPSDTEITVTVTVADEPGPVSVVVPAGSVTGRRTLTRQSSEAKPSTSNPSVSPVKDENYTYQVVLPEVITDKFKAYYGVMYQSQLDSLTGDLLTSMNVDMIDAEGMLLKFLIPSRDTLEITDDDIETLKCGLVVAMPKSVYDDGKYSLLEHTFQSPTEFVKYKELVLGTTSYAVLKLTYDDVQFVPRYNQEIEYDFDLKYVE